MKKIWSKSQENKRKHDTDYYRFHGVSGDNCWNQIGKANPVDVGFRSDGTWLGKQIRWNSGSDPVKLDLVFVKPDCGTEQRFMASVKDGGVDEGEGSGRGDVNMWKVFRRSPQHFVGEEGWACGFRLWRSRCGEGGEQANLEWMVRCFLSP